MARHEDPILALSTAMSVSVVLAALAMGLVSHFDIANGPRQGSPAPADTTPAGPTRNEFALPTGGWSPAEVIQAREACMHSLRSISAEVTLLDPVKVDRCGTPAPVLLHSLGSNPKLTFNPPITTNCRLMTALSEWNKRFLQPAAIRTFKSPVTAILGASSYACRNVYGLSSGNLSQHAFGNAIDIGAFELANDRLITVLHGWGPTERDMRERLKLGTAVSAKPSGLLATGRTETAKLKDREPALKPAQAARPVPTSEQAVNPAAKPTPPAPEMSFLRSLRSGACGPFATVLGPEANDVHRNHLHFDLNPARSNVLCQ